MQTAATERQADADRAAWQSEQAERRRAQDQARQDAEDAQWRADVAASEQQARDDAARAMAGGGLFPNPAPDQPPTASQIPGMECTGVGDDASCDALSSY